MVQAKVYSNPYKPRKIKIVDARSGKELLSGICTQITLKEDGFLTEHADYLVELKLSGLARSVLMGNNQAEGWAI